MDTKGKLHNQPNNNLRHLHKKNLFTIEPTVHNLLIQGLQGFASAYLDDLVLYSNSWEDHLQHLRQVLQQLPDAGLTAMPKRCQFAMEQCNYLGHIVGNGVWNPELDKVEAICCFAIPKTETDI